MLARNESQLVQRAAQRDVAAWSALYEAHYDDVYAYAYSRLGAREDAEDVASQVFVDALKNIAGLVRQLSRGDGAKRARPFLSWLLDFARKLSADRQRQAARAQRDASLRLVTVDPGDTAALLDHLDLLAALKHLTQEQQDVIILRFLMAKTTPEIAVLLERRKTPSSRCSSAQSKRCAATWPRTSSPRCCSQRRTTHESTYEPRSRDDPVPALVGADAGR